MNIFYVYMYLRARDSANGKAGTPYYVGKGKGDRAVSRNHLAPPPVDPRCIVYPAKDMAEKDALQAEMLLIHLYGRIDVGTGCLRNRTDGGEGTSGAILSPAHKLILQSFNIGNTYCVGRECSTDTRRKIGDANRGHVHSDEARKKMSDKGVGKVSAFRGRAHSEESRKKMSGARLSDSPSKAALATRRYRDKKRAQCQ